MLTISYFHTNTHTETFALLITSVTDDTHGEKCSSRSNKFMTSMN